MHVPHSYLVTLRIPKFTLRPQNWQLRARRNINKKPADSWQLTFCSYFFFFWVYSSLNRTNLQKILPLEPWVNPTHEAIIGGSSLTSFRVPTPKPSTTESCFTVKLLICVVTFIDIQTSYFSCSFVRVVSAHASESLIKPTVSCLISQHKGL